jgi:hypothetical protein
MVHPELIKALANWARRTSNRFCFYPVPGGGLPDATGDTKYFELIQGINGMCLRTADQLLRGHVVLDAPQKVIAAAAEMPSTTEKWGTPYPYGPIVLSLWYSDARHSPYYTRYYEEVDPFDGAAPVEVTP